MVIATHFGNAQLCTGNIAISLPELEWFLFKFQEVIQLHTRESFFADVRLALAHGRARMSHQGHHNRIRYASFSEGRLLYGEGSGSSSPRLIARYRGLFPYLRTYAANASPPALGDLRTR